MRADKIIFQNFRNIEDAEISFSQGANILFGANAQGKTNALEGMFLFAQGRSFRTSHEREFVGPNADFASATLKFTSNGLSKSLSMRFFRDGRKACLVGNSPIRRMSEFVGRFRAVLFCPANLSIVKGGPSERRSFIDCAMAQTDPSFLKILSNYNSVLQSRNAFLINCRDELAKGRKIDLDMANVLARQLAESGSMVAKMREEYCETLSKKANIFLKEMSSGCENLEIKAKKALSSEEYESLFSLSLEREIKFGSTLFGPHKDEFEIEVNSMAARAFCSQGQQRSIVLSLKLSEAEISGEKTGEYPILLLDDVLSELDEQRRDYLISGLGNKQVIITSCDNFMAKQSQNNTNNTAKEHTLLGANIIRVNNGRYEKL